MGWMDLAGAAIGGGGLGGLAGLAGVVIQQWGKSKESAIELKKLALTNEQTLKLKKLDDEQELKRAQLNAVTQERIAEMQAMARATEADAANIQASFKHDSTSYTVPSMFDVKPTDGKVIRVVKGFGVAGLAAVDILRGFIRPVATVYALVLNSVLIWWAYKLIDGSKAVLTPAMSEKLLTEIVFSTTFLISTVVLWWFGARPNPRTGR
jgi:hypothetical protein